MTTATPSTSDTQSWCIEFIKDSYHWTIGDLGPWGSGGRLKGKTVVRPIVYGNTAKYLGQKRESDGHTHEWSIYVKPYYQEDMSKWVRKVQFKLHESYQNATRVVEQPPYEVSETGWGEFECVIKIYFQDSQEKPVTAYHVLKLFHADAAANQARRTLVNEYYDQIVFNDPTPQLQSCLASSGKRNTVSRLDTDFVNVLPRNSQLLLDAHAQVRSEITDLRESLKEAQHLLTKYRAELPKYEAPMADEDSNQSSVLTT